jgi:hypothetical protein
MMVNGLRQLSSPESENPGGFIMFGLFVLIMFGGFAIHLFSSARGRQVITIVPILNVVKIGERAIPFHEIADIAVEKSPITMMEGVVAIKFMLYVNPDEKIELGYKAMESDKTEKIDKLTTEVIALLKSALKKI